MINRRAFSKVILILLIVASLAAVSAYSLSILLKTQLISAVQHATGRKLTLANAHLSLLPLRLQLQDASLQDSNGQPFINFKDLAISVNLWQSISQSALVIEQFSLIKPTFYIVKRKNGSFNFDDLIKTSEDDSHNSLFPITVNAATLSGGQLVWQTPNHKEQFQAIRLTLANCSLFAQQKCHADLQVSLKSGGQLTWQAQATLQPLQSTGHIQIQHLNIAALLTTIAPELTEFSLTADSNLSGDYQLSYQANQFKLQTDKTAIELHNAQYSDKASQPMIIKAAQLNHDFDLTLSYHNNAWQIHSNKSKLQLQNAEFSDLANRLLLKTNSLTHESDIHLQSKDDWQLSAKNSKLTAKTINFDYINAAFKANALQLETAINNQFGKQTQVIVQQGNIHSQQLQLFGHDKNQALLDIPNLLINGIDFNLEQQNLSVASVRADNANFRCDTHADYAKLFTAPTPENNTKTTATTTNPRPWNINVKQTDLAQCATTFVDYEQKKPVTVTINPINLKLTDYNNKAGSKLPLQFDAVINKTGSLQFNGNTSIEPFSAQLNLTAKTIELEPFQPYLEKLARLDIIDGKFTGNGKLSITIPEHTPLDVKFTGDSSISDFITRDQQRHKDFITWKKLSLNAINVDLQKDHYTANALIIHQPYAKVTVKKDKTLNFADVFISQKPTTSPEPQTKTSPHQTYFKLDKLEIIDGSSDFADKSLILPFAAQIKSLDGGASDISSETQSTIKVSLKGNAYDLAPVDISGHISPYRGNFDLALNFAEMPMPLISPYMAQFAGYKVEKGKMSLNLHYKVVDKALNASNNILIDQFELGEKIDNPNAVSLPLEMAVALLKDNDGKIKMDFPITGSLDDPQFDIGTIISDALVNTINKVITSPFHAIASLTGDDEAELSTVHFKAGKAALEDSEQKKLAAIANALKEHPTLVLNIKGTAFQDQDWAVLKEDALYDTLKKRRAEEINKQAESKKILPDYVDLSTADYQRLLADLFIEKFPNLAKKSIFGKPVLINPKSGEFYSVAKQQLSDSLKREQQRLKNLASQRARAIASFLVQKHNVANAQVFILDSAVDPKRNNKEIASVLSLQAKD